MNNNDINDFVDTSQTNYSITGTTPLERVVRNRREAILEGIQAGIGEGDIDQNTRDELIQLKKNTDAMLEKKGISMDGVRTITSDVPKNVPSASQVAAVDVEFTDTKSYSESSYYQQNAKRHEHVGDKIKTMLSNAKTYVTSTQPQISFADPDSDADIDS